MISSIVCIWLMCSTGGGAGYRLYPNDPQNPNDWAFTIVELGPMVSGLPLLFEIRAKNVTQATIEVPAIRMAEPGRFQLAIKSVDKNKEIFLTNHENGWGSLSRWPVKPGESYRLFAATRALDVGQYEVAAGKFRHAFQVGTGKDSERTFLKALATLAAKGHDADQDFANYVAAKLLSKEAVNALVADVPDMNLIELGLIASALRDPAGPAPKSRPKSVRAILARGQELLQNVDPSAKSPVLPNSIIALAFDLGDQESADWLAWTLTKPIANKTSVMTALADHRHPRAIDLLFDSTRDQTAVNRELALFGAKELARRKDERAIPLLATLVDDPHFRFRRTAAQALIEHFPDRPEATKVGRRYFLNEGK